MIIRLPSIFSALFYGACSLLCFEGTQPYFDHKANADFYNKISVSLSTFNLHFYLRCDVISLRQVLDFRINTSTGVIFSKF
jgi:hypothetical protein